MFAPTHRLPSPVASPKMSPSTKAVPPSRRCIRSSASRLMRSPTVASSSWWARTRWSSLQLRTADF
ncbi:hypothetical protein CH063_04225 [Colletotrichum higginsianum]|uniref:Uncharacterized protein n=1 Tax=Colletotrichum higginsianum (strain IMI 349063) TaxID=759273 RepID=H1W573_COLHI|nr:hypothetical protein CH063_04225 [Colletotrichum higginsianum]